ncbi:flagellar assembly protein FliH [Peribacillus sp. NPDC097295]|uniref:flagellar assembly protein FliH n=1 Tax=Peribacillus sp. NPDC097295 TaxID=3364402 RepID=UPI0037F13AB6
MSRIIKSHQAKQEESKKIAIKIRQFDIHATENDDGQVTNHYQPDESCYQAKQEADAILIEARRQAEAMVEEIQQARDYWEQQEKKLYIEQAQKEGYQQGIEDGIQKGYNEIAGDIAFAKEVVEASKNDYQQHLESSESVILDLALNVAKKIIGRQLENEQETFLSLVKGAIKEAKDYREVQIHIHPARYHSILSHKEELISIFPKDTELYIYPDDELKESSCIIESENGRIDASVDSQLQEIKVKLTELLEGE